MKKIIFVLLSMFAFVAISEAQMLTTYLEKGKSFAKVTTDYTLTNTTARYWQIEAQPEWYNAQTVVVHLDSLAGNHTNVAVALYGRASGLLGWTAIGSAVNWIGTTSDTTITITNATENLYRQYKLLFTGTGTGTTTIADMEFKFYNGLP
jgi:hypothetical protein